MKKLFFLFLLFIGFGISAQTAAAVKEVFQKLKQKTKIDGNDKAVYNLLDEFYNKNLQAENDEMSSDTVEKFQQLASDPGTKNMHILILFLMYQQHVSQAMAEKRSPNPEFQIETMTLLENETKDIYGKIPAIIYVFKAEALDEGKKKEEAKITVANGLKEYPDSVPLKVYGYLNTKDEALRQDLIKNHSHHWMVQQFDIK